MTTKTTTTQMTTTMNKLRGLLILFMILCTLSINTQAQQLSPSARVSIITVAPGEELYSSFGHTTVHIADPATGLDRNYNYGTFDFRADNFYVKFLRGTLPYTLYVGDLNRELYYWQYENRGVREQFINLLPQQKQRLFDLLEENYRPENRFYPYRFYYDNCSTRPRDMLVKATNGELQFQHTLDSTKTFRQWMNDYLGQKPWERFGMNLAIGYPADEEAGELRAMYLPNNLHDQIGRALIKQPNGQTIAAVAAEQPLFIQADIAKKTLPIVLFPEFVFAVLGLLIGWLTVRQYRQQQAGKTADLVWLDRLLFGFVGLCGWLLLLLWIATDHGVTAWNPAVLWLFPFHLPLIFWATNRRTPISQKRAYFGIVAVLIFTGAVLSRVPGGADTLLALTLLIRCVSQFYPVSPGLSQVQKIQINTPG
jgi:uncharacterized membrane protein